MPVLSLGVSKKCTLEISKVHPGWSKVHPHLSHLPRGEAVFEALREKVSLLGKLHEILFKLHILKIEFLHDKIIFFVWIFFLTRYGWVAFKNGLYKYQKQLMSERPNHLPSFGIFCDFLDFLKKNHKIFQNLEDGCAVLRFVVPDICRVHF